MVDYTRRLQENYLFKQNIETKLSNKENLLLSLACWESVYQKHFLFLYIDAFGKPSSYIDVDDKLVSKMKKYAT